MNKPEDESQFRIDPADYRGLLDNMQQASAKLKAGCHVAFLIPYGASERGTTSIISARFASYTKQIRLIKEPKPSKPK